MTTEATGALVTLQASLIMIFSVLGLLCIGHAFFTGRWMSFAVGVTFWAAVREMVK